MKSNLKIVDAGAHTPFAELVASQPEILALCPNGLVGRKTKEFHGEGGEFWTQIGENVRHGDAFIIQPTPPRTNDHLMALLVTADALRRASAASVTAVVPYFGYARQDRKDKPRVPISAKLVLDLIATAGISRVVGLDIHADQIQGFTNLPFDHLSALPVFVPEVRALGLERLVVVGPDIGAVKRAQLYRDALKADLGIIAKLRHSDVDVEATELVGDVQGRDVLVVDDLTESAGTLCAAAQLLRKRGAARIFAAVTHGVLSDLGRDRLAASEIEEVLVTDSVPQAYGPKVRVVSVAPLFAKAIAGIHTGESVTALFRVPEPVA